MSGESAQSTSVSNVVFQHEKQHIGLTKIITHLNLPVEFESRYEWDGGENTLNNRFIELGPDRTKWRTTCDYTFHSFLAKLMGPFFPGMFHKQNLSFLRNFKASYELGTDSRDQK